MGIYNLYGEKLETTVAQENYIEVCKIIESAREKRIDSFQKDINSYVTLSIFSQSVERAMMKCLNNAVEDIMQVFYNNDVYELSKDSFIATYLNNDDCIGLIREATDGIKEIYSMIHSEELSEIRAREYRKDTRGRFIGGGFGVEGAVKGAIKAGMLNAGIGAMHSLGNAIGNAASKRQATKKEEYIMNYSGVQALCIDTMNNVIRAIKDGLVRALEDYSNLQFEVVSEDEKIRANNIVLAVEEGNVPKAKIKEQLLRAWNLNPFNASVYRVLLINFYDSENELENLGRLFLVNVDRQKDVFFTKWLEEKCEKINYDLAVDKLEDKLSKLNEEAEAKLRKLGMLERLSAYSASKNAMEELNNDLEEVDVKVRTIDGVTYDTKEEAKAVKQDASLHDAILLGQNFADDNVYEQVKEKLANALFNSKKYKEIRYDKLEELRAKALEQEERKNYEKDKELFDSILEGRNILNDNMYEHVKRILNDTTFKSVSFRRQMNELLEEERKLRDEKKFVKNASKVLKVAGIDANVESGTTKVILNPDKEKDKEFFKKHLKIEKDEKVYFLYIYRTSSVSSPMVFMVTDKYVHAYDIKWSRYEMLYVPLKEIKAIGVFDNDNKSNKLLKVITKNNTRFVMPEDFSRSRGVDALNKIAIALEEIVHMVQAYQKNEPTYFSHVKNNEEAEEKAKKLSRECKEFFSQNLRKGYTKENEELLKRWVAWDSKNLNKLYNDVFGKRGQDVGIPIAWVRIPNRNKKCDYESICITTKRIILIDDAPDKFTVSEFAEWNMWEHKDFKGIEIDTYKNLNKIDVRFTTGNAKSMIVKIAGDEFVFFDSDYETEIFTKCILHVVEETKKLAKEFALERENNKKQLVQEKIAAIGDVTAVDRIYLWEYIRTLYQEEDSELIQPTIREIEKLIKGKADEELVKEIQNVVEGYTEKTIVELKQILEKLKKYPEKHTKKWSEDINAFYEEKKVEQRREELEKLIEGYENKTETELVELISKLEDYSEPLANELLVNIKSCLERKKNAKIYEEVLKLTDGCAEKTEEELKETLNKLEAYPQLLVSDVKKKVRDYYKSKVTARRQIEIDKICSSIGTMQFKELKEIEKQLQTDYADMEYARIKMQDIAKRCEQLENETLESLCRDISSMSREKLIAIEHELSSLEIDKSKKQPYIEKVHSCLEEIDNQLIKDELGEISCASLEMCNIMCGKIFGMKASQEQKNKAFEKIDVQVKKLLLEKSNAIIDELIHFIRERGYNITEFTLYDSSRENAEISTKVMQNWLGGKNYGFYEFFLVMHDSTLLGGNSKGFVLSSQGLYYNGKDGFGRITTPMIKSFSVKTRLLSSELYVNCVDGSSRQIPLKTGAKQFECIKEVLNKILVLIQQSDITTCLDYVEMARKEVKQ